MAALLLSVNDGGAYGPFYRDDAFERAIQVLRLPADDAFRGQTSPVELFLITLTLDPPRGS